MKRSDIVATWVVAAALVGAVGLHSLLPDLPPRLGYGVETLGPRASFTEPGVAGPVVPPDARPTPTPAPTQARGSDLADVLQGLSRWIFKC
jgi:hypothetical protein